MHETVGGVSYDAGRYANDQYCNGYRLAVGEVKSTASGLQTVPADVVGNEKHLRPSFDGCRPTSRAPALLYTMCLLAAKGSGQSHLRLIVNKEDRVDKSTRLRYKRFYLGSRELSDGG